MNTENFGPTSSNDLQLLLPTGLSEAGSAGSGRLDTEIRVRLAGSAAVKDRTLKTRAGVWLYFSNLRAKEAAEEHSRPLQVSGAPQLFTQAWNRVE